MLFSFSFFSKTEHIIYECLLLQIIYSLRILCDFSQLNSISLDSLIHLTFIKISLSAYAITWLFPDLEKKKSLFPQGTFNLVE